MVGFRVGGGLGFRGLGCWDFGFRGLGFPLLTPCPKVPPLSGITRVN